MTTTGAALIAVERQRQIEKEGWTAEHDAQHTRGELVLAAICYAGHAAMVHGGGDVDRESPGLWPWAPECWKPSSDPVRDMIKAGALIAAEIDRVRAMDGEVQEDFVRFVLDDLANRIMTIAKDHGWESGKDLPRELLLMTTEIAEACEADRHGNPPSEHIPAFSGVEEELADVVIRVLETAKARGYDLPGAIQAKMAFNASRPFKHGGKAY